MNIGRHHQQPAQHDLSQGKVFAGCTPEQRRSLISLATVVTVPAGRDLTVQGAQGLECGVIIEGEAIVLIDGHEVARLGAGDHYGELALLDDPAARKGRRATVTTTVATTVAAMTIAEFQTVLEDMPDVRARIMQTAFARASY
jgi:CRP/FNR family transcriptional regulator, cyclic AMP receptor protein